MLMGIMDPLVAPFRRHLHTSHTFASIKSRHDKHGNTFMQMYHHRQLSRKQLAVHNKTVYYSHFNYQKLIAFQMVTNNWLKNDEQILIHKYANCNHSNAIISTRISIHK